MIKTIRILGLFFACPLKRLNKDCPFYSLRNKTAVERVNFLKTINIEDLNQLEKEHMLCFGKHVHQEMHIYLRS